MTRQIQCVALRMEIPGLSNNTTENLKQNKIISKTGVNRGIHFFLIFALKHRLWVLVNVEAVLTCTHNLCFKQK